MPLIGGESPALEGKAAQTEDAATGAEARAAAERTEASAPPTFKTPANLTDHFERHGPSMGFENEDAYLNGAQNLVKGGPNTQVFTRLSGDKLFYNTSTNEFGVLSPTGNIRTYYQPDEGITYWFDQTGKK